MADEPIDVTDPIDNVEALNTGVFPQERRRPGRNDDVNPELVRLLRGTSEVVAPLPDIIRGPDYPSFARGLTVGLSLAAAFWLVVGAVALWLWL